MRGLITAAEIKTYVTWASAVFALAAALLWWRAATVTVYAAQHLQLGNRPYIDTFDDGAIAKDAKGRNYDVIATAIKQGYWNKLAALAACVSATLQGVAVMIPER